MRDGKTSKNNSYQLYHAAAVVVVAPPLGLLDFQSLSGIVPNCLLHLPFSFFAVHLGQLV